MYKSPQKGVSFCHPVRSPLVGLPIGKDFSHTPRLGATTQMLQEEPFFHFRILIIVWGAFRRSLKCSQNLSRSPKTACLALLYRYIVDIHRVYAATSPRIFLPLHCWYLWCGSPTAFASPDDALATLMRVGEVGLVDVEPLAIALTSLETDTAAARSSGLVGLGTYQLLLCIYTQL